jgi:hypothetical protein
MKNTLLFSFVLIFCFQSEAQQLAILKYDGGGDWYSNPTSLPNLVDFCNKELGFRLDQKINEVSFKTDEVFAYPFIHMTGHGNVVFSSLEVKRIRQYLEGGGFLHIDDNYGMDEYIRPILEKLFLDSPLKEIGKNSFLFNYPYPIPNGLPKVHDHDSKPPQAFVIERNDRIVLLYTFESDLGDGWEDAEVHNDPKEVRERALKMGANILSYAFSHRSVSQ